MTAPTRDEALATLHQGRLELAELLAHLTHEQKTTAGTIGGGAWSAKDLVGHLAYWQELALQALEDWRAGHRPGVELIFAGDDAAIDETNATDVARKAAWEFEEVRTNFEETHVALEAAITTMGDEEWTSKAPYPTEKRDRLGLLLGSILGAPKRPFGHAFAHLPDLQAYVASR